MTTQPTANDVLSFWFEELDPEQHFKKDPALDADIMRRFEGLHGHLKSDPSSFTQTAKGTLAAILVFDQFSRNMFRGQGKAFETDTLALSLSKKLISSGGDLTLSSQQRIFAYMPFMHAETLEDQRQSVALYTALGIAHNIEYAHKHLEVVEKFGRFPHRNAALGRVSTTEEEAYIKQPGTAF